MGVPCLALAVRALPVLLSVHMMPCMCCCCHHTQVDDANFKKLVAIIRIAVPYTGMILSTRESAEMRDELLKVGGIDELQFGVANW